MVVILSPNEIMRKGLLLAGFSFHRQQRVCRASNLRRFKAFYGSAPIVLTVIWEDLQTTLIPDALIGVEEADDVDLFLLSMHYLRVYPTEPILSGLFKLCEKTGRKWAWHYADKIAALKIDKIVWPEEWTPGTDMNQTNVPIFIVSVDGVHFRCQEPKHPLYSKNPQYYSHKFKQAALTYELALSIYENKLVWINGPFPAGTHDITVFRGGLKNMIPAGKRAIGDNGYRGEPYVLSVPSSHDSPALRQLKGRARARQETFNARIKDFKILFDCFRHDIAKHQTIVHAVCVIVQYQMENGSPLFEV